MGIPSRNGDPQQHIWKALPSPARSRPPLRTDPPPRPAPPGFAPALSGSRRVPSHIGDPREHNRDRPREHNRDRPPTHSERTLDLCSPGLPRPGCAPGAFPAAVATTKSTTGKPSPTPARSRTPPRTTRVHLAPGAFPAAVVTPESTTVTAPHPLPTRTPTRAAQDRPAPGALSGRCPLPPGAPGEPRPHARFQEMLSDLATAARSNTRTIHPPHRDNPSCL